MHIVEESGQFKKVIFRNVTLPLVLAVLMSAAFISIILRLVEVGRSADHSAVVISKAYQTLQLIIDGETGTRGFLVTGRENFLEPYRNAPFRGNRLPYSIIYLGNPSTAPVHEPA